MSAHRQTISRAVSRLLIRPSTNPLDPNYDPGPIVGLPDRSPKPKAKMPPTKRGRVGYGGPAKAIPLTKTGKAKPIPNSDTYRVPARNSRINS